MYSRVFSGIDLLVEVKYFVFVWVIESMVFYKIYKVFFEVEVFELVGVIMRFWVWFVFRGYGVEIFEVL